MLSKTLFYWITLNGASAYCQTALNCPVVCFTTVQRTVVQGAVKVSPYTDQQSLSLAHLAPPGSNQYSLIITYNQSRHVGSDGDW